LSILHPLPVKLCAMKRIGIVDMGSGTARLVVYDFEVGQWFRLTDEIRESVRLGEGFAATGQLSDAATIRALDAIKLYADYATATNLGKLTVIATSAVREAANSANFLSQLKGFNLDFRILSGEQEAQYGALAVANSFQVSRAWVMDLGGGSAQISRLENRLFMGGKAFPLGYVRLTEQFLHGTRTSEHEVKQLEKFVIKQLEPTLTRMQKDTAPLIAMGGTIRNLARAVQKLEDYPLDALHGYELKREALEALIQRLLDLPVSERATISGIHADRADAILAGALVYRTVLRETGAKSLIISGQGVREGAFYKEFVPQAPHLLPEVRIFSVQNLFAHYPQDQNHTQHVRKLSRKLFEALEPIHGYGAWDALLLDAAAYLHDIGMAVSYHDHHKHSAYLVLNTQMPGLTHREQILLALLVQYHRKGDPKLGSFKKILEPDDEIRLVRLAACLRLAEYLERSRSGRVHDLKVSIEKEQIVIDLIASQTPRVELWEASKHGELFRKAFGRDLVLEADQLQRSGTDIQDKRRNTPGGKTKRK
jgi:exopolyphosphatase / guanosine-5'-triphosphate,3'-diphosphate pyrophosphatase